MNRTARVLFVIATFALGAESLFALGADSPFIISDDVAAKLPAELKKVIAMAEEDYFAALNRGWPIHAKRDTMLADGGTAKYQGEGYKLTVVNRLAAIGGIAGFVHGPILTLTHDGISSSATVSHVRFYSQQEYEKMKKLRFEELRQNENKPDKSKDQGVWAIKCRAERSSCRRSRARNGQLSD